jgi:cytochrome oxidase assembly protein ShyY1
MTQNRFHYHFEWRLTLFTFVCFTIFVRLGFWQLDRADYKVALAADYASQSALAPASASELLTEASILSGRKVRLDGTFLPEIFLLDNQVVDGQFGNDVIQVFQTKDPKLLFFVNRGWVKADPSRLQPTAVPEFSVQEIIEGEVYIAPGTPFTLGSPPTEIVFPQTIQSVNVDFMTSAVHKSEAFYPHLIRLSPDDGSAYKAHWALVNVSPSKHQGYAVQWFAMALALGLLYLHRSTNIGALIRPTSGAKNDHDSE